MYPPRISQANISIIITHATCIPLEYINIYNTYAPN
jgi:hypothetical protein